MAVSLITPPLPIHFSRNACELKFSTNKIVTAGSKYKVLFIFATLPDTNDDTLEISFERDGVQYDITFTFKSSPDADLYEIPTYSGLLTDWLQVVINELMSHPDISANFDIALHSDDPIYGIMFQANFEDGNELSGTATGFNLTQSNSVPGAVGVAEPEFRMSAWLYVGRNHGSDGTDMMKTKEIELDANEQGLVQLNFQRYLTDYLHEIEPLAQIAGQFEICRFINRPAFVVYGQKWNAPYERQKQGKTDTFRVLKGGMEPRDFAVNKDDLDSWLYGSFLTLRKQRRVHKNQDDFLFFHATEDVPNMEVRYQFYYTNQSVFPQTAFSGALQAGETYQFKCGLLDLDNNPSNIENLFRFEVWLADGDDAHSLKSEKIEFLIDDDHLDAVFIYENSLGAIEPWKFNGDRVLLHQISKELYRTELPFDSSMPETDLHSFNELNGVSMECNTGAMTKEEARAFPNFLLSRHVYLQTYDSAGKESFQIPVRIPGGKAMAQSWNRKANHGRVGEFTVELGVSRNVGGELV